MDPLISFPIEIMENILGYLFTDWKSVSSCQEVNKYWHEYITHWVTALLEKELGADPRLEEERKKDFKYTMYFVNGLSYLRKLDKPLALSISVRGIRKFGMERFEEDLPRLTNLVALRINGCPKFPSLHHLTKLEYMEIIRPGGDFKVQSLPGEIRTMICANSPYNVSLHVALIKLTKLESLQLAFCGVRVRHVDRICQTVGEKLKSFALMEDLESMLIGIYNEVTRLTNLEFLHLENSFYDETADHLKIVGSLTKLTALSVRGCLHDDKYDAPKYQHLSSLTRLKELFFYPSHLNIMEFLPSITTLTNLERLYIDVSNYSDEDMKALLHFTKLETLSIFYSKNFTPNISVVFNQLPALRKLDIFSFQIPNEEVVIKDLSPSITVAKHSAGFDDEWFSRHGLFNGI